MKRKILFSLILAVYALCVPILFSSPAASESEAEPPPETSESGTEVKKESADSRGDSELRFVALIDGEQYDCLMADFLPGVLAGEMPAAFEEEALKAQAVAARTYIMGRIASSNPNHPDADICDDPSCCQAFMQQDELQERWGTRFLAYWRKMCDAVEATDGQYMTYNGEPILAAFHSSSGGKTEDAANLWSFRPYLSSVFSPEGAEDVPNFVTTVEVSPDDFRNTIRQSGFDADLSGEPGSWIGGITRNESGRVEEATVGGASIDGNSIRAMFSLRSAAFEVEYTGEYFLFTVTGYGHGVGMSQYGANVMAKGGSSYLEILEHYYVGVTIEGVQSV